MSLAPMIEGSGSLKNQLMEKCVNTKCIYMCVSTLILNKRGDIVEIQLIELCYDVIKFQFPQKRCNPPDVECL
jgi:hypothetical protein